MAYDDSLARHDAEQISSGRLRPIRAPSFYKKYFWSTKVEPSADVREALQLATLAGFPLPQRLQSSRTAMAYLAIRRAQAGLAKDPDDVNGYLALGQAYDFLSQIEYQASLGVRPVRNGVRYLQAVAAYNQALVGEPDNMNAHQRLIQLYREARKPDLAFRHLSALDDDMLAHPDHYTDDQAKMVGQQINELNKLLKQVDEAVAQAGTASSDSKITLSRMQTFLQRECLLRALVELERDGKQTSGNAQLEQLRIRLLLETGRVEEAYEAASRFAAMAEMQGVSQWADNVSPCMPGARRLRWRHQVLGRGEQRNRSNHSGPAGAHAAASDNRSECPVALVDDEFGGQLFLSESGTKRRHEDQRGAQPARSRTH